MREDTPQNKPIDSQLDWIDRISLILLILIVVTPSILLVVSILTAPLTLNTFITVFITVTESVIGLLCICIPLTFIVTLFEQIIIPDTRPPGRHSMLLTAIPFLISYSLIFGFKDYIAVWTMGNSSYLDYTRLSNNPLADLNSPYRIQLIWSAMVRTAIAFGANLTVAKLLSGLISFGSIATGIHYTYKGIIWIRNRLQL